MWQKECFMMRKHDRKLDIKSDRMLDRKLELSLKLYTLKWKAILGVNVDRKALCDEKIDRKLDRKLKQS